MRTLLRSMNDGPRYATLGDYLRVLRRNRLLILAITLAFGGGAYALSKAAEPVYVASASISFRDISQDANPIGEEIIPTVAAAERAAREAELIGRPEITREVKRRLSGEAKGDGGNGANEDGGKGDDKSDGEGDDGNGGKGDDENGGGRGNQESEAATETETDGGTAEASDAGQLSEEELADAVTARVDIRTNLVTLEAESSDAELAARIANAFSEELRIDGQEDLDKLLDKAADRLRDDIEETEDRKETGAQLIELSQLRQRLASIELLETVAEPVVINRRATVPGSPNSPQPARNTVIGLLVGLIFGLLAAFVRSSLDRKVYSAHDVHEELGLPVLGRIPASALGYAGLAPSGRLAMSETDFEAYRMLRMNLSYLGREEGRPVRSVVVTSGMPEEGKTSVSMALASAAALTGQRVLLVECDLRRPSFARRFGTEAQPGLTDYLSGVATPAEILQTVELEPPATPTVAAPVEGAAVPTKLICISAGTQVATPAELLVSERFGSFVEKVSSAYDLVVFDTSPLLAVVDPLEVIPHVDAALVLVRVLKTNRDQVRAVRAALAALPDKPFGAVATGLKRGDRDSGDYYYGY
jgi:capsular exopolysaccharide synthesis family protein